jgi:hypothetical protein
MTIVSTIVSSIVRRKEPEATPPPQPLPPAHARREPPGKLVIPETLEECEEMLDQLRNDSIQCRSAMEHAQFQKESDPHYKFDGHWYVRAKAKLGYINHEIQQVTTQMGVLRRRAQRGASLENVPVTQDAMRIMGDVPGPYLRRYHVALLDVIKRDTAPDQYEAWLEEARLISLE